MKYEIGGILIDDPVAVLMAWVYENQEWIFRELTPDEIKAMQRLTEKEVH